MITHQRLHSGRCEERTGRDWRSIPARRKKKRKFLFWCCPDGSPTINAYRCRQRRRSLPLSAGSTVVLVRMTYAHWRSRWVDFVLISHTHNVGDSQTPNALPSASIQGLVYTFAQLFVERESCNVNRRRWRRRQRWRFERRRRCWTRQLDFAVVVTFYLNLFLCLFSQIGECNALVVSSFVLAYRRVCDSEDFFTNVLLSTSSSKTMGGAIRSWYSKFLF